MKENSLRRKIEKKLQCVAEKEVELSNKFPDISECKRNVIYGLLADYMMEEMKRAFDLVNPGKSMLYFMQLWHQYLEYF